MTFVSKKIEHNQSGIVCMLACSKSPCNCLANNWYKSFRPCLWFLHIARPNIANTSSFLVVLFCPHHTHHTKFYVCDRLNLYFLCNVYIRLCLFHPDIFPECTQHNTLSRFHFGNNPWGNFCTFQCQKALEIDRRHIWHNLFSGYHESFFYRPGRFHTM